MYYKSATILSFSCKIHFLQTAAADKTLCGFNDKGATVDGTDAEAGDWPWAVAVGKFDSDNSFDVTVIWCQTSPLKIVTKASFFI